MQEAPQDEAQRRLNSLIDLLVPISSNKDQIELRLNSINPCNNSINPSNPLSRREQIDGFTNSNKFTNSNNKHSARRSSE